MDKFKWKPESPQQLIQEVGQAVFVVGSLAICLTVIGGYSWLIWGATMIAIGMFESFGPAARRRKRAMRRAQGNQCLQCGYDLRENTSGICPECGVRRDG